MKGCDILLTNLFYFVGKRHEASELFTKMLEEGIKPGMVCTCYIAQTYEIMIKRYLNSMSKVLREENKEETYW